MVRRIVLLLVMGLSAAGLLSRAALAADPAPEAQGETAAGDAEHGHSKPPLLADPLANDEHGKAARIQALWVFIIFVVLLAVLYPTAWKNVLAGLKAREERIRKDIAEAEATSRRAQATLQEYNSRLATAENQVRDMISKAVADGEKAAAEIRMRATQEAEEGRLRATREIDAARKQALNEIYASAADISTSIAEKILRRNINVEDQRTLVQQSLEQLQAVER